MSVLFVVPCGRYAPSGVVRVRRYLPYLRQRGVRFKILDYSSPLSEALMRRRFREGRLRSRPVEWVLRDAAERIERRHRRRADERLALWASRYDAVFLQWVVPEEDALEALLRRARNVIFDFDDAVFLERPESAEALVRSARHVVAGSHFLHEYALERNPRTSLIPSSVDVERFRIPASEDYAAVGRRLRLGWIGGPSTLKYLSVLVEPLRLLAARGIESELALAGVAHRRDLLPDFGGMPVSIVDGYRDEDVPALVAGADVGVMPLTDGPWERGKCAMKALTHMAGGKPCVASRVGENAHVIQDGVNGFLAVDAEEWAEKLALLLGSPELRAATGARARRTVEDGYSTGYCFRRLWREVLAPILGEGGAGGRRAGP